MFQRLISRGSSSGKSHLSWLSLLLWLAAPPLSLPALAQTPSSPSVEAALSQPSEKDYTLGPGDRFRVDIYDLKELSGEYLVLVDGSAGFPLVGQLKVEGLTVPQLKEILSKRYARYIKRPVVTVSLVAPRPLEVAISGEVKNPGSYTFPLADRQKFPSLTDAIQQAGGLTAASDISQVQVRRMVQGAQHTLTLNLLALLQKGDRNQNITLRDGDTILIPTKNQLDPAELGLLEDANFGLQQDEDLDVAIVGEVYRPGSYQLADRRTVRNRSNPVNRNATDSNPNQIEPQLFRLTDAIELAGGIKPLADIRRIEVRRLTRSGQAQTLAVNLWDLLETGNLNQDPVLQDGDTIVIPTARELDPQESERLAAASFSPDLIEVNVVGEVKKPGAVEIPPNAPLNQALLAAGGFNLDRAEQATVELIRLNPNGTVSKREIAVDFSEGVGEDKNPPLRNNDMIVVNRSNLTATTDGLVNIFRPLGIVFSPLNFFRFLID